MSQESSGQTNLEMQLDKILDEYVNSRGATNQFTGDVSEYLLMDRDDLEAMSREDRHTAALRLSQFSIYVQRLINRERARINWASSVINSVASKYWDNYSEMIKADIKIYKIAAENPTVDKAIKIRNNAQIRVDELDGVALLVRNFSDIMMRSSYVNSASS